MVNWFRRDADGKFLWPGYGENLRVLKWILDRIDGRAGAYQTPVGIVPDPADLDLAGLEISREQLVQALAVDAGEWKAEMESANDLFTRIGRALPAALRERHRTLTAALDRDRSSQRLAVRR